MRDHNGQPSIKIVAYKGDREILKRLCIGLRDKGFDFEYEFNIGIHIASVVIYPYLGRFTAYSKDTVIAQEYVTVTPENIDTFINNLQP